MLRRSRFGELVDRQLDLFASDEAALLEQADDADAAWSRSAKDESEQRFGEYQLVVDVIGERLYEIRETYAATLDDETADEYRAAFTRAATRRFRRFSALLEE